MCVNSRPSSWSCLHSSFAGWLQGLLEVIFSCLVCMTYSHSGCPSWFSASCSTGSCLHLPLCSQACFRLTCRFSVVSPLESSSTLIVSNGVSSGRAGICLVLGYILSPCSSNWHITVPPPLHVHHQPPNSDPQAKSHHNCKLKCPHPLLQSDLHSTNGIFLKCTFFFFCTCRHILKMLQWFPTT